MAAEKRKGGAPRKTAGDANLIQQLGNHHDGNFKLAKPEFVKTLMNRDGIEKKSAYARFNKALKGLRT